MHIQPRRSMLFMPASNQRVLEKAKSLNVDTVIFDLEDAVLPSQKQLARESAVRAIETGDYGFREVLVRINGLETDLWQDDILALAGTAVAGVVVPKIEHRDQLSRISDVLTGQGADLPIWMMLETAAGVLAAPGLCAFDGRLAGVLVGTADLGKTLKVPYQPDRLGLISALSHCVLASRSSGLSVIDGVFMDVKDAAGFEQECEQGKALGFDGKTLIHPAQLDAANRIFAPSLSDVERAKGMIEAWQLSAQEGSAVCLFENRLVEELHVIQARELIDYHDALQHRMSAP